MGTGSCSSSNCHGSVNPIKGSPVLQNEYYTWLKHDRHSKAYSVLTTEDAKKMARHLQIGDPSKAAQCLVCHTTYVPEKDRRGERYTVEDGVSCESCHGASEGWLASHSESTTTHARNIANGLTDTVSLHSRAKLCLSCHYGDDTKRVTHELYGAGHPRLRFELDTFGILQPKHWLVDDDYKTRKADYIPLKAWLVGQATQAESLIGMLRNPHNTQGGLLPELSLFDCFSCHHNLSQAQWKTRSYGGSPGKLQLNLTPLRLVHAALTKLDPGLAADLGTLISVLTDQFERNGGAQAIAQTSTLLRTRIQPYIAELLANATACSQVMQGLAQAGATTSGIKFEFAEQVGMGIQAALATSPELQTKHSSHLKQLFKTIESADSFEPKRFSDVMKNLEVAL
jgi:hypothetical protein